MLLKKSSIVYNQVNDGNNGAGGSNAQANPPVPPPTQGTPPPQAQGGIEFDQFGYPKTPPQQPPAPNQAGQTAKPPAETPPAPGEAGSLGYDAPPPAPETPPAPPPPGASTPPAPAADPNAHQLVEMKELAADDQKKFGEYFTAHKLSKEAQQAFVDMRKAEIAANAKAQADYEQQIKTETAKLKSDWYNELKNDKDFGGSNFDVNTKLVNKFVQEFMPNTKKVLTEKGGMLPPSTMRDFLSVAKRLFETEKVVTGDGSGTSETTTPDNWKFLGDLYPNNG